MEDTRIKIRFSAREALVKSWDHIPREIKDELERKHDTLDRGKIKWVDVLKFAKRRMA